MGVVDKIVDGVVEELLNRKAFPTEGTENLPDSFDKFNGGQLIDKMRDGLGLPSTEEEAKKEDDIYRAVIKKPSDQPLPQKKTVINTVEEVDNSVKQINSNVTQVEHIIKAVIVENDKSEQESEELLTEAELKEEEQVKVTEARHASVIKTIRENAPKNFIRTLLENLPLILTVAALWTAFREEIIKAVKPFFDALVKWLDSNFPNAMKVVRSVWSVAKDIWNYLPKIMRGIGKIFKALGWLASSLVGVIDSAFKSMFDPNGIREKADTWADEHPELLDLKRIQAMSDSEINQAISEIESHQAEFEDEGAFQDFMNGPYGQSLRMLREEKRLRDEEFEESRLQGHTRDLFNQSLLHRMEEYSKRLAGDQSADVVSDFGLGEKVWPQVSEELAESNPNLGVFKEGNVPEGYTPGEVIHGYDMDPGISNREREGKRAVGMIVSNDVIENIIYKTALDCFNIRQ